MTLTKPLLIVLNDKREGKTSKWSIFKQMCGNAYRRILFLVHVYKYFASMYMCFMCVLDAFGGRELQIP